MPKQKRPQAKAVNRQKPLTANPLFPAVIALWFGALFGLGSLAVRPSLLESLVIQSRIDLVVPAAAPPLGITARALLALLLAALGAIMGASIARRIARPKPEVRERKRSTLASREEPVRRNPYASSAAISTSEMTGSIANRRRSLTVEHEERDFIPHEMAPLPGGAPQVLDIAAMNISAETVQAPLELTAFADQPASEIAPASAEPESASFTQTMPNATEPPAPSFAPALAPLSEAAAAAADGRQVFGMATPPPEEPGSRQIFGQTVRDDHVSQDFIKAAGYSTTVFDAPEPNPLFAPRQAQPASAGTAEPMSSVVSAEPAASIPPNFSAPAVSAMPVESAATSEFAGAPMIQAEPPATVAEAIIPAPQPTPVSSNLGMTDLASRLAESMARRRAARSGTVPDQAGPVPPVEAPAAFEPAPAAPASFATPQAYEPAPIEIAPAADPEPNPFVLPSAPQTAMTSPAIPAAMRPLELDGFEDDGEPLDHLLPPRRIVMPEVFSLPAAEPVNPSVAAPEPAFAESEDAAQDAEVEAETEIASDESAYASLLGLAPATPRDGGFVRIEEPEPEEAAIEPVVIFPGQVARAAAPEPTPFRQFDAPASAGQGQPVAASQAPSQVDREEADRALRMALANLQRMSGAA